MTISQAASAKAILWFATYIKCIGAGEREAALYAIERHHKLLAWLAARNDRRIAQLEAVNAKLVETLKQAYICGDHQPSCECSLNNDTMNNCTCWVGKAEALLAQKGGDR